MRKYPRKYDKALTVGLRPDSRMPRNAQVLETCDGFVPSEMGLKAVNALTSPFDNTYDSSGNLCSYGRLVDIVTDGDFSTDPSSYWLYDSTWTWDEANTEMDCAASADLIPLQQSPVSLKEAIFSGQTYYLKFTVANYSAGTLTPNVNGTDGTAVSADGDYFQEIVAGDYATGLLFQRNATFVGSVKDVSLSYIAYTAMDWPWPQIFRGRAVTLLAGDSFIATVDENTWYTTELTLYDSLNQTSTVTIDPTDAGPWHFLDFGTTWALFNGNVVVYKYAGDTKTYLMRAPRIYSGCAFRGRAVIAGLPDGFPAVWRAIYDTLASNDTRLSSHALSLGKNFVLVSSPGGGGGNPGNVFAWADPSQNGSISGILGSIDGTASVSSVDYITNGAFTTSPITSETWKAYSSLGTGIGSDTFDINTGWGWDSSGKTMGRKLTWIASSNDGYGTIVAGTVPSAVTSVPGNIDYNLLTNGGFTGSASGWTLGACWSYDSNTVVFDPISVTDEIINDPTLATSSKWITSWGSPWWTFSNPGFTYTDAGFTSGTNTFYTSPTAWVSRLQPSTDYQVTLTMSGTWGEAINLRLYDDTNGIISSQAIPISGGVFYITTPANLVSSTSALMLDFFGHIGSVQITGFSVKILDVGPGTSTEADRTISQSVTLSEESMLVVKVTATSGASTGGYTLKILDSEDALVTLESAPYVTLYKSFVSSSSCAAGDYTLKLIADEGADSLTVDEIFVGAESLESNAWAPYQSSTLYQPFSKMAYSPIAGNVYELTYTVDLTPVTQIIGAPQSYEAAKKYPIPAPSRQLYFVLGGVKSIPRTISGTYTEMITCGSSTLFDLRYASTSRELDNELCLELEVGKLIQLNSLDNVSLKGNTTTTGGAFDGIDPVVDDTIVPDGDGVITGDIDSAVGLQKYVSLQRSLSRNDWMFMPMSFQGEVLRAEALGKSIMVFGEDGVCCMIPRTIEDVHTFQLLEFAPLRRIGLKGRGAVAVNSGDGTDESGELLFVDTQGWLWYVDTKLQPKKLGYREFFSGMGTIVGSYHAYEDEFWFSDGTVTYVWNRSGLGQAPQDYISTIFADQTGTTYATIDPNDTASTTYSLTTHPFNAGAPGMSSINEIAVLHTGLVDPEVALSYRYIDTATGTPVWGTTSYVRLNEQGFAHIKVTADEFKVHVRGTASTDCKVEGLIVEWELEDKRFIRSFMIQEQGMPGERG